MKICPGLIHHPLQKPDLEVEIHDMFGCHHTHKDLGQQTGKKGLSSHREERNSVVTGIMETCLHT